MKLKNLTGRDCLICTMQTIRFGKIQNLVIHNGEPLWSPLPVIKRDIKLSSDGQQVTLGNKLDTSLERLDWFFKRLSEIGDGTISIEIHHGLPHQMTADLENHFQPS